MRSRLYSVYQNQFTRLSHHEDFVGPEKVELVFKSFRDFYLRFKTEHQFFIIFATPTALEETPSGTVEIPYFSITDILPEFDKHSIIYQLYAQMSDPFENIDDAKFIRINLPL
jgi:hypothetical protein